MSCVYLICPRVRIFRLVSVVFIWLSCGWPTQAVAGQDLKGSSEGTERKRSISKLQSSSDSLNMGSRLAPSEKPGARSWTMRRGKHSQNKSDDCCLDRDSFRVTCPSILDIDLASPPPPPSATMKTIVDTSAETKLSPEAISLIAIVILICSETALFCRLVARPSIDYEKG